MPDGDWPAPATPADLYNSASAERGSALALLHDAATRLIDAAAQYRQAAKLGEADARASTALQTVADEDAQRATNTAVAILDMLREWRDCDRSE